MERLKPCPFCAGKPYMFSFDDTDCMSNPFSKAIIRCTNCEAKIDRYKDGYVAKIIVEKMAVEAWNRRAEGKED